MKYLLGIDIGTTSCKTTLFDFDGNIIVHSSRSYEVLKPKEGYAEQNPEDWFSGVVSAIKEILGKGYNPDDIVSIGVDGQSWSCIPIDKKGSVLYNTPIWFDTRSTDICEDIKKIISEEELFKICGNPLSPSYSLPKVLWFKKHMKDIYDKTYMFLQSNSYIVYKLTGVVSQDLSQSYGYQFFNINTLEYDLDLAKKLGVDMSKIPPIYHSSDVVGYVSDEASKITGLSKGTMVVAGGLDAACATLGVGVINEGDTQEQGGTAGGMSICTKEAISHPKLILGVHVVNDRWLLQGGTTGGSGVMSWWVHNFGDMNKELPYDEMRRPAKDIAPGSDGVIFLPYFAGERSPIWDPKAKGVFYGLDYTKTRHHMTRALLEGVAYALRDNIETAYESGVRIKKMTTMGGGANSEFWTQIKADVTKIDISIPTNISSSSSLGAAILAGIGAKVYKSFDEAINRTIKIRTTIKTNKENYQVYDDGFKTYKELYKSLKEIMDK